ncbi:hypothetical protein CU098_013067, partial [Rhizopus stolonifer]
MSEFKPLDHLVQCSPSLFSVRFILMLLPKFTFLLKGPAHLQPFRTRLFSTGISLTENVRGIMRKVPLPVVVVTTSKPDDRNHRRGITVSSFTSVCLHPEPLVSFCVQTPSRASDLLHSSGSMVLNLLSHEQVLQSIAFSSPNKDQFKDVPFFDDPATGLPVLMGT